jgi:predicted component of type VI protein secretion system
MQTDAYTKSVLTVIAVCLLVLVLRGVDLIPRATATPQPAVPAGHAVVPVNADGTVNARIVGMEGPLKVNVVEVAGNQVFGEWLPVRVRQN